MDNDAVTVIVVGSGSVSSDDLLSLARARTLVGREGPIAAVQHLCPPRTHVVVGDPTAVPDGAERPVVLLRTPETPEATAAERKVTGICSSPAIWP